jgi:hypothetical protein
LASRRLAPALSVGKTNFRLGGRKVRAKRPASVSISSRNGLAEADSDEIDSVGSGPVRGGPSAAATGRASDRTAPQHRLNLRPLPHGQGTLRPDWVCPGRGTDCRGADMSPNLTGDRALMIISAGGQMQAFCEANQNRLHGRRSARISAGAIRGCRNFFTHRVDSRRQSANRRPSLLGLRGRAC